MKAGVAARLAGRPLEAINVLEPLTVGHEGDADLWLNLGLADFAAARLQQAEDALHRSLLLAPAYVDADIALARVLFAENKLSDAQDAIRAAQARDPGDAEAAEVARQIAAALATPKPHGSKPEATPVWRMDAVVGYSHLTHGNAPWRETDLALGGKINADTSLAASFEDSDRFNMNDTYFALRSDHTFANAWSGYLGVGGAPDSHFRARWTVQAGGLSAPYHPDPDGPWTVSLGVDANYSRYPVGDVRTVSPYFLVQTAIPVAVTLQFIESLDEQNHDLTGFRVGADWSVSSKLLISGGYADAPESDTGHTMQVRASSAAISWAFTDTFAVKVIGLYEVRPQWVRDEVDLAVTERF